MKALFTKTLVAGVVALTTVTSAMAADITGAGATFPYPIYAKWAEAYKAKTKTGLNYQSIGSSGGIKQIKAKTVDFGASDAPVKFEDLEKDGLVQFPAIIGGVVAVVNVDGIKPSVISEFHVWRREKVGRELSGSAQNNHNAALNLIFDEAIERGYMTSLQKPVLKNTGEQGGRRPDFSAKEIEHILEKLPAWVQEGRIGRTRNLRELLSVYVPFAAATGMRPGTEMEYLEWRHIEVHDLGGEPVLYAHIQKGKTVKKNKPMGAVLHRSCWLYLEKLRQTTIRLALSKDELIPSYDVE